jgi:hypothetical protein
MGEGLWVATVLIAHTAGRCLKPGRCEHLAVCEENSASARDGSKGLGQLAKASSHVNPANPGSCRLDRAAECLEASSRLIEEGSRVGVPTDRADPIAMHHSGRRL